jgi:hypothetical protein
MSDIIHGRRIVTEVYYEGIIARNEEQYELEQFTDRNAMLKDVIDALAVITNGTSDKLELEICVDKKGRYKLTRRWSV